MTKNNNQHAGSQSSALSQEGGGPSTQAQAGNSQPHATLSNKKGKGVAAQSSGDSSASAELFSAVAEIKSVLDRLSNKEASQALTMLAALRNLRVISMDRPIGPSGTPANQTPKATARKVKGEGKTPPAAWKQDVRWENAQLVHRGIIAVIKTNTDPTKVESMTSDLRQHEQRMKDLKQELQGKLQTA